MALIVVGGGTAGLAVSSRTSQELPGSTVLVVEAGPDGRNDSRLYTPGRMSRLGSMYDWNFTTTPQPHANNRIIPQHRGHVLGCSSALSLHSWDRAAETDYDAWEEMCDPGWNWENMHPAMEAQETLQQTAMKGSAGLVNQGAGENGPVHFLVNRFSPPQQEAFFPRVQNLGLNQTYEVLNGDVIGWMRHTSNIVGMDYTRSYAPMFLTVDGSNLRYMINTTVAKVNLDQSCKKAIGLTLQNGTIIAAKKETILAAAGIKQLVDLPGVSENLQDHVRVTIAYQLKDNYTSPDILRLNATYAAEQLAMDHKNISSWYDETSSGYTYIQWQQAQGINASAFGAWGKEAAARGNVVDQKKLPNLLDTSKRVPQLEVLFDDGHPICNPNYLSSDSDLQAIAQAAKYMRHLAYTPPMRYTWDSEYEPGLQTVTTDAQWLDHARANVLSIWHPTATTALLPLKEGGVVGPDLMVYPVEDLRVDACGGYSDLYLGAYSDGCLWGIAKKGPGMMAKQWA
ncbi:hypothetical protein LTR62_008068 [Meristemomyces frigidus]|uniref:Uncharacterized protein n=1 Tax=Meristemomyces frigidus TaxID=1508187 RepID=A0AAN7YM25_9PEZI|nr:hypothetical protein LTR62_008068 [Meristemomyces frigidus]